MQNFHKNMGQPAFGIPLRTMALGGTSPSSVFGGLGDFGHAFRSVFDPFDIFGVVKDLSTEIIHAPVEIVHEVGTALTGVAHEAGGAVGNVAGAAKDLFSSPILLIGGAAVLLMLLSR
jgi:hypothetical protein